MTMLEPQRGAITVPIATETSQPYWDGLARKELLFQLCGECGGATHTPALVCAHCGSRSLSWTASSGLGTIYSYTVVWRPQTPAFTVPYVPIIVDMAEGWQILSSLVGCEHDRVEVGLDVAVEFHPVGDGVWLPYFRPR
jgi:hypothetical protein